MPIMASMHMHHQFNGIRVTPPVAHVMPPPQALSKGWNSRDRVLASLNFLTSILG